MTIWFDDESLQMFCQEEKKIFVSIWLKILIWCLLHENKLNALCSYQLFSRNWWKLRMLEVLFCERLLRLSSHDLIRESSIREFVTMFRCSISSFLEKWVYDERELSNSMFLTIRAYNLLKFVDRKMNNRRHNNITWWNKLVLYTRDRQSSWLSSTYSS